MSGRVHLKRICLSLTALCLMALMTVNMSSCGLLFVSSSLLQEVETEQNHMVTAPAHDQADQPAAVVDMSAIRAEIDSMSAADFAEADGVSDYVKISFKDYGDVVIRLRSDIAPITVENFQGLVKNGFYDGLTIHRVVKNFVIQGGDPWGNGTGGSGTAIKGEFAANGVQNDLSHVTGVISMARKAFPYDSATSQFFICNANASRSLDGQYAGFGYVVAGLDVILAISDAPVQGESPAEKIVMEKVCFVTK